MIFTSEHKDSSYFRNGVFNNDEWTYKRCCLFGRVSKINYKLKLKLVYATRNTSVHARHLLTYGQNVKAFFDLNNC
jgi:hypothetical protein